MKVRQLQDPNLEIKPVKLPSSDFDEKNILGYPIFEQIRAPMSIGIYGKRGSGKTTTLVNVLRHTTSPRTSVILFSKTAFTDPTWMAVQNEFLHKGIPFTRYQSIFDEDDPKINIVASIMHSLQIEDKNKNSLQQSSSGPSKPVIVTTEEEKALLEGGGKKQLSAAEKKRLAEIEKKERHDYLKQPRFVFVFDDIANELKDKAIAQLIKNARHFHATVIISTQSYYDVLKAIRINMEYVILCGQAHPQDRVEAICSEMGIDMKPNVFYNLYKMVTQPSPYDFLFVNISKEQYRRNFNQVIEF